MTDGEEEREPPTDHEAAPDRAAAVGAALIGHRTGDTVAYETPTGAELRVRILEVTAA